MPFAKTYTEDFLYDLENDPYENNNLIDNPEYSKEKEMLRKILVEYMKKAQEPDSEIIVK